MAPESFLLDPALEELLLEVAADPDSSLLRVPRPKALPALFDNDPRVSDRMAGLNLAERELLRVHRAELAELLLEVCRYKLIEGPRSRLYFTRFQADGGLMTPLRPEEAADLASARCSELDGVNEIRAAALINRCVADGAGAHVGVSELAAAAERLRPSRSAKGLAAQDLTQSGRPWTALRALQQMVQPAGGPLAVFWGNVGLVYSRLGQMPRAHQAYVSSCAACPSYTAAWIFRFMFAVQLADEGDARHAGKMAEGLLNVDSAEFDRVLASLAVQRKQGEWAPTGEALRIAVPLRDALAGVARRMADVMC